MENYLDLLPSELRYTIFSYVEESDLLNMENVNYEQLFEFRFPKVYSECKQIFKIDKYTRRYSKNYEVLYFDYIKYLLNFDTSTNILHEVGSLLYNVINRVNIFNIYKEYYKYLEFLDKSFSSDVHSGYLLNILHRTDYRNLLDQDNIQFTYTYDPIYHNLFEKLMEDYSAFNAIFIICLLNIAGKLKLNEDEIEQFNIILIHYFEDEYDLDSYYIATLFDYIIESK